MALDDPAQPFTYSARPRAHDPAALVQAHLPMVRRLAWHVAGRAIPGGDLSDLVQCGMVALVEAAQAYEDRGHAFSTYATMRVRGAMIDQLRRNATITRTAMQQRRSIDAARARFTAQHGRAPAEDELGAAMGVSAAEMRAMIADTQPVAIEPIDEVYSDHSPWFADDGEGADEAIDREATTARLAEAIAGLPEREAMILQLYFIEELNLHEIGETMNIGAARVCQIKKAALSKLRGLLADDDN